MGRMVEAVILPSFAFEMVQKSSLKFDDMNRLGGIFRSAISIRWDATIKADSTVESLEPVRAQDLHSGRHPPHPNRKCTIAIAVLKITLMICPHKMVCGVSLGKGSMNVAWTSGDWQRGANPPHLRRPRVHVGFRRSNSESTGRLSFI